MVKIRKSLHQAVSEWAKGHNACVIRHFTHRPPDNGESDASIAFWLRKDHSAGKPLPQLAIREDATFFVQSWTKKLFFANKDPKANFDASMILQKPVLSFIGNAFLKNGQFESDIIFCHFKRTWIGQPVLKMNKFLTHAIPLPEWDHSWLWQYTY